MNYRFFCKLMLLSGILLMGFNAFSQSAAFNNTGASAVASAMVEVSSTTKGFLPPRMTGAQRDAIATPAAGLTVWCTNCGANGQMQVYNGTAWTNMIGGSAVNPLVNPGDAYQGGKVFYILQPGDLGYDANVQHGLIASLVDIGSFQWFNNVNSVTGAIATAIGTGSANTATIIASQGAPGGPNYAANATTGTINGYSNWYLPSRDELMQLYINRALVGGFQAPWYQWSSSEVNVTWSYAIRFDNGNVANDYIKGGVLFVRPIRSF